MALAIIRGVGRLRPEIRLGEALASFEADLTPPQKARFRERKKNAAKNPPTINDVMRLTGDINREASGRFPGKSCFGTRFTGFLRAIQQFAGLGEAVLGGTQNSLTCNVWSMIHTTLVSYVALSSHLEKISAIVMDIGRSAPQYENMASLYPHSKKMASYMIDYWIVIVNLCHHLVKFTKKGFIQQLPLINNDPDLKLYESELKKLGAAIDREARILAQSNGLEQNSSVNAITKLFGHQTRQQRLRIYHRVLDAFSKYDYQATFIEVRKAGDTFLFKEMTEYKSWKAQSGPRTLACVGKLGSGKSVWMANIFEDLRLHDDYINYPMAYFFCRHDISESLKARTIIGSLIRQLLSPDGDFSQVEEIIAQAGPVLHFDKMLEVLRKCLKPNFGAYIIVDGLDDCDDAEQKQIYQHLQRLQEEFTIRICISSRQRADLEPNLNLELFGAYSSIVIPNDNPDIQMYIKDELERCMNEGRLVVGDQSLFDQIRDALVKESQGMFLWVALQISSLCACQTDRAIRKALADLPKDLSETFDRILERSGKGEGGKDYQRKIMEILIAAREPLTAEQLGEALSVIPGDTTWDPEQQLNDVSAVLGYCGSLIYIDEQTLTVRMLHSSVKQFLLGYFSTSGTALITETEANERMAAIIITYLNYNIFNTEISTKVAPKIEINDAATRIIRSMHSSSTAGNVAVKLLRVPKQSSVDIGHTVREVQSKRKARDQFHFRAYAELYWIYYLYHVSTELLTVGTLHINLLKRLGIDISWTDRDEVLAFVSKTIKEKNQALLKVICSIPETIQELSRLDGDLLNHVVKSRHQDLLGILIDHGLNVDTKIEDDATLLWIALKEQNTEMVKMLIGKGANINHMGGNVSMLHRTTRDGYYEGVALLIAAGADLEATGEASETPIFDSIHRGHIDITRLLIDSGANLEATNGRRRTPLLHACYLKKLESIKLLVESGANLEAVHNDGLTALLTYIRFCGDGDNEVVEFLIGKGANIEVKSNDGRTALSYAAWEGHEETVQLLLKHGANIEAKSNDGMTALSYAAGGGKEETIQSLLKYGANIEAKCNDGRTALSYAAWRGYEETVQSLLKHGANIEAKCNDGRTALSYAAGWGYEETVRLLLKHGANPWSKDEDDKSPLYYAELKGFEIVKMLNQYGGETMQTES